MIFHILLLLLCLLLVVVSSFNGFTIGLKDRNTSRNNRPKISVSVSTDDSVEALEGAIEPMKKAIDSGFKEGKSIAWGVLQRDLDESKIPDLQERKKLRAQASKELVNIDNAERNRRKLAGSIGAVISTVLYGVLVTTKVSTMTLGLSMYVPVAFSLGFIESGRKGL